MSRERQNTQRELSYRATGRGEASTPGDGETGIRAEVENEPPRYGNELMEEICKRSNIRTALDRVVSNKGAPGVDGMHVNQLRSHLNRHWPQVQEVLLAGKYKPLPVRRIEIPKPDGGVRLLGIPTVMDRLVQQAILQVLQPRWDPTFSVHSHGFRPNHRQHDAIAEAQQYVAEGYAWVIDLDLEKFFDRVHHDRLLSRLGKRIEDQRLLKLIGSFLKAGVMSQGLISPTDEGTPQGGPLSPFLSNIVLDELDRELEKRDLRFVRYADDCNIYVRTERAGKRVMDSVSRFITNKLRLKVNTSKSDCETRRTQVPRVYLSHRWRDRQENDLDEIARTGETENSRDDRPYARTEPQGRDHDPERIPRRLGWILPIHAGPRPTDLAREVDPAPIKSLSVETVENGPLPIR